MNSKNIFLSLATLVVMFITACSDEAQSTSQASNSKADDAIEIIQFHSEHRCITCNKIEELSRETLKSYPDIQFTLVNVDDDENEKQAEEFEAYGTALFLFNPQTGEKKNLTEFAFMTAGNEDKFIAQLKKEIDTFLKS